MTTRELWVFVRDRWLYALCGLVLGLVLSIVATSLVASQYASSVSLYVSSQTPSDSPATAYQGSLLSQQRVKTYTQLVTTSARVSADISASINGLEDPAEVQSSLSSSSTPDSVVFSITATDQNKAQATAKANAAGVAVTRLIADLESPGRPGQPRPVSVRVVEPASVPVSPVSPTWWINLTMGALAGLALGLAFAYVRAALDTTVRSVAAMENALQSPSIGTVPRITSNSHEAQDRSVAEAFKKIRTNLAFLGVGESRKVVSIVSSVPGEGKTTVSCQLASVLAEAGNSVVIVDADLRKPRVADRMQVLGEVGLSTVLAGQLSLEAAIQRLPNGVSVLTSGVRPPNPSELMASNKMRELVETLGRSFQYVLIDTPPLLPVTDAAVVGALSDGVVVVTRYGIATVAQLELARNSLHAVGAAVFGSILTGLPAKHTSRAGGYEYYSDEKVESKPNHGSGGTGQHSSDARTVTMNRRASASERHSASSS